jgi:hypothetical protein
MSGQSTSLKPLRITRRDFFPRLQREAKCREIYRCASRVGAIADGHP